MMPNSKGNNVPVHMKPLVLLFDLFLIKRVMIQIEQYHLTKHEILHIVSFLLSRVAVPYSLDVEMETMLLVQ